MVLIIHPKKYYPSKIINYGLSKIIKSIDPIDSTAPPDITQPDPIMQNIQKETEVKDLGTTQLSGEGFKVYGAGSGRNNSKLRKFINLKL